jgi:methionine--tRNA ligase beta chain
MSALSLIDSLIGEVELLPQVRGSSSSSSSSTKTTSTDCSWDPITAIGHTTYSWSGEGEVDPFNCTDEKKVTGKRKLEETPKNQPKTEKGGKGNKEGKKKEKKEKKKGNKGGNKGGKGGKKGAIDPDTPDIAKIDIRVGKIVKAWKHPDADSLYCEHIDIGEEQPRQVCSGLVNYIPHKDFEGSDVLCIVNLKPANMRGVKSYGMVLAAKSEDGKTVELVKAPKGSYIGERLSLEGDDILKWTPELSINSKKKNSAWAKCAVDFKTNAKGEACYKGVPFVSSKGPVKCSLANVPVA